MKRILSIDLGTSATVISVATDDAASEPEIAQIDGRKLTPTWLKLSEDGREAESIGLESMASESFEGLDVTDASGGRTFTDFKQNIGKSSPAGAVGGRPVMAAELTVLFLGKLREKIENLAFKGKPISRQIEATVIGYPAAWPEIQIKSLIQAAQTAGFPNVLGCADPIGLIYWYHFKNMLSLSAESCPLIYDFGAGSTDVSLVKTGAGLGPEVIAAAGTDKAFGRVFDDRLYDIFIEKISNQLHGAPLSQRGMSSIRLASKRLKEKLSLEADNNHDRAVLTIPWLEGIKGSISLELTADEFEKSCQDLIDYFMSPVGEALNKAGMPKDAVKTVILSGGSSRLYFVHNKIQKTFPQAEILHSPDPQEDAAKGLALFGRAKVWGEIKPSEFLTDETVSPAKKELLTADISGTKDDRPMIEAGKKKSFSLAYSVLLVIIISIVFGIIAYNYEPAVTPPTDTTTSGPSETAEPERENERDRLLEAKDYLEKLEAIWAKAIADIYKINPGKREILTSELEAMDPSNVPSEIVALNGEIKDQLRLREMTENYYNQPISEIGRIYIPRKMNTENISTKLQDKVNNDFYYNKLLQQSSKILYKFWHIYNDILKQPSPYAQAINYKLTIEEISCTVTAQDATANSKNGTEISLTGPHLFLAIAEKDPQGDYLLDEIFPLKGPLNNSAGVRIGVSLDYYVLENNPLWLVLYDEGRNRIDFLTANEAPTENFSGHHPIGRGCSVAMKVAVNK
jgi:actin-like ATPase involved in cell morphogenesis